MFIYQFIKINKRNFSQNPFLFDGDVIKIGVNNGYKFYKIIWKLSPNKIDIFVIGEVNDKLVRVKSNSISKAILAAGGPGTKN